MLHRWVRSCSETRARCPPKVFPRQRKLQNKAKSVMHVYLVPTFYIPTFFQVYLCACFSLQDTCRSLSLFFHTSCLHVVEVLEPHHDLGLEARPGLAACQPSKHDRSTGKMTPPATKKNAQKKNKCVHTQHSSRTHERQTQRGNERRAKKRRKKKPSTTPYYFSSECGIYVTYFI